MKIGILGTRGIPNQYGGFEQCAAYVSELLASDGHDVTVYCSSLHPYRKKEWKGVRLVHCFDPEDKLGTAGQFIYDLNCFRDARRRGFDALLQLGYTSSAIWYPLWPGCPQVINMDGLEWKRSKYGRLVKRFLKFSESLAARKADLLIADSLGIKDYLYNTYKKESVYIAYGADIFTNPQPDKLMSGFSPGQYDMLIARMEPENNIETIIKGFLMSRGQQQLLIVGNYLNRYGQILYQRYGSNSRLCFAGPVYDIDMLNNMRYHTRCYFHGHSVGGTNPSLIEAMASGAFIVAHDNPFNKSILGTDALYFSTADEIAALLNDTGLMTDRKGFIAANLEKVSEKYNWQSIAKAYETALQEVIMHR